MFPEYRNWSIFLAGWIQSISYHRISLRFFLISSQLIPRCFKRNTFYIFIEYTIMQRHHQQFTVVASFVLFRPSSESESFRIKENPHNLLNVKIGRDLPTHTYIYIYFPQIICIFPHYFFLPCLLHVPPVSCFLITLSQSYLKRRTNYEISHYTVFFTVVPLFLFQVQIFLFISPYSKVNIF